MRTILVFSLAIALVVSGVALLFFIATGMSLSFSHDSSEWARFGNYFGGVAGSLLSFFSVLLIYYTLEQTNINLNISNKNIEMLKRQISIGEEESLKKDLLLYVEKHEREIDNWLKRNIAKYDVENEVVNFGDIVWGIVKIGYPKNDYEVSVCCIRLNKLLCSYCQAIRLYEDNINSHYVYHAHYLKAKELLEFLKKNKNFLETVGEATLDSCEDLLTSNRT